MSKRPSTGSWEWWPSHGLKARLNRPLDFLVVSDHSENLGLATAIAESNPELLKNEWGKMEHDLVKSGLEGGIKAYDNWMATTAKREDPLKDMTELTKDHVAAGNRCGREIQ